MENGVFETIAVHKGKPILLNAHLDRLERSLFLLNVGNNLFQRHKVEKEIMHRAENKDKMAIKIAVNPFNIEFSERDNPYLEDIYNRGFDLCFSDLLRDETSPLTYLKVTDRMDLENERKKAQINGVNEVLFLNSNGFITEGAVSNVFCIKRGKIMTPGVSSGLLDGTIRRFLISVQPDIMETFLTPKDLFESEEIFITNSLLGIMPVRRLNEKNYLIGGIGSGLHDFYNQIINL